MAELGAHPMSEKVVIGVSGVMMNRGIAQFGLQQLGEERVRLADHFQMHPWQAMQILNSIFLDIEKGGDDSEISGRGSWTFEKIRVVEDDNFPHDRIELRDKDEHVLVEFRNVGSLNHEYR